MEVRADWSYEAIPSCEARPEGAKVIQTTGEETGVYYLHDIVYAKTTEGDLRLQILIPNTRNQKIVMANPGMVDQDGNLKTELFEANPQFPCILYVQGSAWFPQYLYGNIPQLAKLAARGFVVAVVEYRDSLRAHFPTPILDTLNAVRFLRKSGKIFCVDPDKIVVSGDSSGGHTALMTGFWCQDDKGENLYPGISSEVKGIVSFYPACDFSFPDSNPTTEDHCKASSPEGMYMGHGDMSEEDIQALTARNYVSQEAVIPPTILFHGTKDRLVNTMCSVYLYEKMKECGKDVQLYLLGGADHGGREFWTDEILDIIEAFVRRVI